MSNKIGRIVAEVRRAPDQIYYKLDIVTADLATIVETLQGIAIGAEYKADDIVHINVVQGRHYIVSSKGQEGETLRVLGKWDGSELDDFSYQTDNDLAKATLIYVAQVLDNALTYDAIVAAPDAEIGNYPKEEGYVLCRLLDGNPTKMVIPIDTLIAAYAVEGMYFIPEYKSAGGGGAVPCKILTKVSGMTYTYNAEIYENGIEPGEGFTSGEVEQVNINADQTIPDGTWAMASLNSNGIWYVQVAVWL